MAANAVELLESCCKKFSLLPRKRTNIVLGRAARVNTSRIANEQTATSPEDARCQVTRMYRRYYFTWVRSYVGLANPATCIFLNLVVRSRVNSGGYGLAFTKIFCGSLFRSIKTSGGTLTTVNGSSWKFSTSVPLNWFTPSPVRTFSNGRYGFVTAVLDASRNATRKSSECPWLFMRHAIWSKLLSRKEIGLRALLNWK